MNSIQQIGQMCKEFLLGATVHGFRFFVEPKLHWIERVWWVVSCIASVILCAFAVIIIWTKWHEHPVMVTFNDKTTPIAMIPFPALTICSTQKYKERLNVSDTDNIYPQSLFSNDLNKMDAISQTCAQSYYQYWRSNLDANSSILPNQSIYEAIEEISPNKSSMILLTLWTSSKTFANFTPIFTEEGLCFTFNSINSEEMYTDETASELKTVRDNPSAIHWNMEDGYQPNISDSATYPHRVFAAGLQDALEVVLAVVLDDTFRFCEFFAPGFLISLHLPDELARFSNNYIFVPAEQTLLVSIKPNMITTSESLRSYAPHDRGCYFKFERRLRFFKTYSKSKCELECLANFTAQEVGCVRFFMPRDESTKICRLHDVEECRAAERNFLTQLKVKECNCLPDCFSVGYDVETSHMQYYHAGNKEKQQTGYNKTKFTTFNYIYISFKETYFMSLNRSETFTMTDFIASCGGLLGLFMGISMLSVVELIYYFTLRLCCKWRRQQRIETNLQAPINE